MALDPPKVLGISSGGGGLADLQAIAAATGAFAPPGGVDCDGDGIVDLLEGDPLVCTIASSGEGIGTAIIALAEAAIKPVDTTPPLITILAAPRTLWPPNGKMVPVTISGTITDSESGVDTSTAAYAVTDEYGSIQPSGTVTLGTNGSYSFTIQLQASRNGNDKDGRQYIITVDAQDDAGNKGSAATGVVVPHDQGKK
jgi:hypothetical protein